MSGKFQASSAHHRFLIIPFFLAFVLFCPIGAQSADWTIMDSGTDTFFRDVWGSSSTDVFACGYLSTDPFYKGYIFYYDGANWSLMPTPPNLEPMLALWGSSPSDVFAGGSNVILHFDGVAWSEMTSGRSRRRPIGNGTD